MVGIFSLQVLLLFFFASYSQTDTKVIVVPLGGIMSTTAFNDRRNWTGQFSNCVGDDAELVCSNIASKTHCHFSNTLLPG